MSEANAILMMERQRRVDQIINMLSGQGITAKDIQAKFDCGASTAHSMLRDLEQAGKAKSAKIQLSVGGKVNFYFAKSASKQTIQNFVKKHSYVADQKWKKKKKLEEEPQLESINDYVDMLRGLTSFKPPIVKSTGERHASWTGRKPEVGICSAQAMMEMS